MRRDVLGLVACFALCAGIAFAQTAERRLYVMSADMRHDLEERQFDSQRVEEIVNGVAVGFNSGDLKPILDAASPTIRITNGNSNVVVQKQALLTYKDKMLKDPALRAAVTDEAQFILKGDEIGLARGVFWINLECLDETCSKKKSSIVTVNLP